MCECDKPEKPEKIVTGTYGTLCIRDRAHIQTRMYAKPIDDALIAQRSISVEPSMLQPKVVTKQFMTPRTLG